jgi:hypothetical protein
MAKRKNSVPAFMKYAGSILGPAGLSSRLGFSTGARRKGRSAGDRREKNSGETIEDYSPTIALLRAPSFYELNQTAQRNS